MVINTKTALTSGAVPKILTPLEECFWEEKKYQVNIENFKYNNNKQKSSSKINDQLNQTKIVSMLNEEDLWDPGIKRK